MATTGELLTVTKELLTRAEAAEYLGIPVATLASWACRGRYELPMVKIGNMVRYRKQDLDRWIEKHTVTHTGESNV